MTVPPGDAGAVAEAVAGWLARRDGGEVHQAEPPRSVGEGFDSWIHLVRLTGPAVPAEWAQPLVVRVLPSPARVDDARREAAVQSWLADQGYPAPRVLAVLAPGELLDLPAQVMERAAGTTMLAAIQQRPWTAPSLVTRLAGLHVRLHALDPSGSPLEGTSLAERRLSLVHQTVEATNHAGLSEGLRRVDLLLPRLQVPDAVVGHGDFHPLNVLVDGVRSAVIDWTDAGVGDRHGDVARTALLFRMAAALAEAPAERAVLLVAGPLMARRYLRSYQRGAPLDRRRLALWEPLHLLHAWAQVVAARTGLLEDREGAGDRTLAIRPRLDQWLEARFEESMACL